MNQYAYNGPVMEFDRCIANNYKATTRAVSPRKALCNIMFRFKKECGKAPFCKISLDEKKLKLVS